MSDPHVSHFELMRHLARELSDERNAALEAHLASCAPCRRAHEALREVQANGRALAPPPPWAIAAPPKKNKPWIAGVLAAAAAAALFFLLPQKETVRSKSSGDLRAYCRAPGSEQPRRCESGDRVAPGTALMFEAHFERDRHLMLLGRDETGAWQTYFPRQGDASVLVPSGVHDFMGASLVLDGAPGEESFVLYAADRSFDRRALEGGALPDFIEKLELHFVEDPSPGIER